VSPRLALAVLVGALIACQTPPQVIRTDVQAYLMRSRAWAPVEADAARTIKRIMDTQFVDEPEIHRQIAESRPRVLAHTAALRDYHPRSDEVRRVHRHYMTAWDRLLAAYDAIEDGFTSGDYRKLARGREDMVAWQDGIVRVADELRTLADHYGIDARGAVESRVPATVGQLSTQST
jgi:hypothetical protein